MSNGKVLVTGANGLLGVNTIIKLLENGYRVIGFLRSSERFMDIKHKNLKLFEGDITNIDALNEAFLNIDVVIHTAAITDQNLLSYDDYRKINVEGVKYVVEACKKNKVKKLIYVSTANQFGYGDLKSPGNENTQMKYPFTSSFYCQSKTEATDYLLSQKEEMDVVIVNPTFMIGAFGTKPSSGKIVLEGMKKRVVLCPSGGKNFVNVRDVSKGILNAMKYGKSGECYLLGNENLSYSDFFKKLRSFTKRKFVIVPMPDAFLRWLGLMGDVLRYFRVSTPLSSVNIKLLLTNNFFSNEKSKRELKLKYNPIDTAIKESCEWFYAQPKNKF